ncbi:MAG: alpha/beta fold hydrolase [Pseudomonadota bacterium]
MLNTVTYGEAGAPHLLIAHGLFGSARNWGVIAKRLSEQYLVTTVDMRNHGVSPWAETQSYHDMAGDLAEVLKAVGPANVVGHSMGGKAAMVLALEYPELVERLVVADIAPVGYTHTQAHLIEFMRKIDLSKVETRGDADRQLGEFIEEDGIRAFLLQSLDVKAREWRLNLDVLEAQMPDIIGFPEVSSQFDKPALFLSGAASDYVLPEHRPEIKRVFPKANFAKIPDAGHWLHAEKPREFEATVRAFFERT